MQREQKEENKRRAKREAACGRGRVGSACRGSPPAAVPSRSACPAPCGPTRGLRRRPRPGLRDSSPRGGALLLVGAATCSSTPPPAPTAAQLDWSWGPERLPPTAGRRRAPPRHPRSETPFRSRDGKSWRRGRLLSRAERAPRGRGARDSPGTGCLWQRLLLVPVVPESRPRGSPHPSPRGRAPTIPFPSRAGRREQEQMERQ